MEETTGKTALPFPAQEIRFTVETRHDTRAMTAMARALRRTLRKKHSRVSHIAGWTLVVLALLLLLPRDGKPFVLNAAAVVNLLAAAAITAALLWEDRINGWAAARRILPGTGTGVTCFADDCYRAVFPVGKSEWQYSAIVQAAETKEYFVLIFSQNHAQVYPKAGFTTGTPAEFRSFLAEKTGKSIPKV